MFLPKRSWQRTASPLQLMLLFTTRSINWHHHHLSLILDMCYSSHYWTSWSAQSFSWPSSYSSPSLSLRSWTRCTRCATSPMPLNQPDFSPVPLSGQDFKSGQKSFLNFLEDFGFGQFQANVVAGTPWEQRHFRRSWATERQLLWYCDFMWFVSLGLRISGWEYHIVNISIMKYLNEENIS